MQEIVQDIIEYLDVIYKFSFAKSMFIMLCLQILYFGCMYAFPNCRKRLNARTVIAGILLTFYASQVIGITLLNRGVETSTGYNGQIFEVYRIALDGNSVFLTQLIGNVVMFVPLGILLPVCVRCVDNFLKMLFVGFGCSLIIEGIQLYTHTGIFELVDLLNNTVGALLGYVFYRVFKRVCMWIRRGEKC